MKTEEQILDELNKRTTELATTMKEIGEAGSATPEQTTKLTALMGMCQGLYWAAGLESLWKMTMNQLQLAHEALTIQDKVTAPPPRPE